MKILLFLGVLFHSHNIPAKPLIKPLIIQHFNKLTPGENIQDTTGRQKNLDKVQYGVASYYHIKFKGRPTASGEPYDPAAFTGAHNGLPLGTWVKVTNLRNKRTVIVRINDRMHSRNKRLIDLSRVAAVKLGYVGRGLEKVKLEVLGKKKPGEAKDLSNK